MTVWVRFADRGRTGFGRLDDDRISVHEGDMFEAPRRTSETLRLDEVRLLTPTAPGKMLALWNNFHALARKLDLPVPGEPLYFVKAPNSFLAAEETIRRPASYDGRVIFEGELGIVIGRRCRDVPEDEAGECIFGYTCVNDITAADLIDRDPTFAQWTRAKGFDTFGPFGPAVATGLDAGSLTVRTVLNGDERQNYPVADMIFPPRRLVSLISRDVTLLPGDVISCGTSVGVGSMKAPRNTVEVTIEGVGTLRNVFVQASAEAEGRRR